MSRADGAHSAVILELFRFDASSATGHCLIWSIAVIKFTVLTIFQFLGACLDGTVELSCHELTLYPDDDNGEDWDSADVLIDSHVYIHASLWQNLDAIRDLCHLANVAVPEVASCIFGLALQNLKSISVRNIAAAAKDVVLEHVPVLEETAVASLVG